MENMESLKLFENLLLLKDKYSKVKLRNNIKEIESNRKLNSSLNYYHTNIDDITNKCNFIFNKTKEDIKDLDTNSIENIITSLNYFSKKRYTLLKDLYIESTTVKSIMHLTIDELMLINQSIENKEYTADKSNYLYIYNKVTTNAFATFLALKQMDIDVDAMNAFSQAIFNQIKVICMIAI